MFLEKVSPRQEHGESKTAPEALWAGPGDKGGPLSRVAHSPGPGTATPVSPNLSPHPGKGQKRVVVPGVPRGPLHVSLVSALGTPLTTSAGPAQPQAAAPASLKLGARISAWNFIFWPGDALTLRSEGSVFWTSLRFQIIVHVTPQRPVSTRGDQQARSHGQAGRDCSYLAGRCARTESRYCGVSGLVRDTDPRAWLPPVCRKKSETLKTNQSLGQDPRLAPRCRVLSSGASLKWLSPSHGKGRGTRAGGTGLSCGQPTHRGATGPRMGQGPSETQPTPSGLRV